MNSDVNLVVNPDRTVTDSINDQILAGCECDNTHQQNDTVCRFCFAHGRRCWNDPEVLDSGDSSQSVSTT